MCLEEEEYAYHLLGHCRWLSSLWDLSVSNEGQLGSNFYCERCGNDLEEKDEEQLGSWSWEHGSFGYLVAYLDVEKSTCFLGQSFVVSRL